MRDWKKFPPRRVKVHGRTVKRYIRRLKAEREDEIKLASTLFRRMQDKLAHASFRERETVTATLWTRILRVFRPEHGRVTWET